MDVAGLSVAALPLEYSSFLDRRAQLTAAREALGSTKLLTIAGVGGVGKTRFAVRLAESVRSLYQSVWFVDLTRVSTTGSVADEVAAEFSPNVFPGDGRERLARYFRPQSGLLLFDNCEHVLDQAAELIAYLLAACPGLTVLATSREVLRLSGESEFLLEPFTTGDDSPAEQLFQDRCKAVLPRPTAADRRAIAAICVQLDGLPLAIELAAARVRALSPDQVLERLGAPFALLTGGVRDAPGRQHTLRAAMEWSYGLCTPAEQLVWRRMSLFFGGWDLRAAEWVCADSTGGEPVLDVVQSLIEKSIVRPAVVSGTIHYSLLETVRTFGIEVLRDEDIRITRERRRDWYIDRLRALEADWYGPNQAYWLSFVQREMPNIRSAVESCLAEGDVPNAAILLTTASRIAWNRNAAEQRQWLTRLVLLGPPPTPAGCLALATLGVMEVIYGNRERALELHARAAELAEAVGDEVTRNLVNDYVTWAADPLSVPGLSAALRRQGGHDVVPAFSNLEERLVHALEVAGDTEEAERRRASLIARATAAGDVYETALMLLDSGIIVSSRGETERATTMLQQAMSLFQRLESRSHILQVEEGLARAAATSGDHVRAATLLGISYPESDPAGEIWLSNPSWGPVRAGVEADTRRALGQRAYDTAIAAGRAMTAEEGIAYAMGSPAATATPGRAGSAELLTARESQVAALVGQGLTNKQIAQRLVISTRTAEGHVANSLMKLGFTSRAQLAAWSARSSDQG